MVRLDETHMLRLNVLLVRWRAKTQQDNVQPSSERSIVFISLSSIRILYGKALVRQK